MINKLPCLYGYINETSTGNRNENLFRAINHLRYYNQNASIEDITNEALSINKAFESPLGEKEVTVICQVLKSIGVNMIYASFPPYCICFSGISQPAHRRQLFSGKIQKILQTLQIWTIP